MRKYEALSKLSNINDVFTASKARELGISYDMLRRLVEKDLIHRISKGLYSMKGEDLDLEYVVQKKCEKCIISHESALYHHGYSERVPAKPTVTVSHQYGTHRIKSMGIMVRSVKLEYLEIGVEDSRTQFGNIVKIYNLERTICDIIRNEKYMDKELLNKAIRKYVSENQNRISLLLIYAEKLGIKNKVLKKIEVLY